MQPAVLLSLLGAAVLAAVSSAPVDNRNHSEEVVTRCIIEVLSNALSKSSIPPVSPECRQVLKKSGKEVKDEEKSENENKKFEVRLLRGPVEAPETHRSSGGEEAATPGKADTHGPPKADTDKWAEGAGHSRERADPPQGSLHPPDGRASQDASRASQDASRASQDAKARHSSKSEGEEGEGESYPHREDSHEERHPEAPGETQDALLSQKNQAGHAQEEELAARWDAHSAGRSGQETHSRESSPESAEEAGGPRIGPQGPADSDESQEDADSQAAKRSRPRHHHGRSRPDRASLGASAPSGEESRKALEKSEEESLEASLEEKRDHHSSHYRASEEEPEYQAEVRSYPRSPEDLDRGPHRGRGSEESQQDKRQRPNSELDIPAPGYGRENEEETGQERGEGHPHQARGGEPGARSDPDARGEKRVWGEGYHPAQESRMDRSKGYPQGAQEQERSFLDYDEDGAPGQWPQEGPEGNGEEARLRAPQSAAHHTAAKTKRLGVLLDPYYDPAQWKRSRLEQKNTVDDSFLEEEEDNGLPLSERDFFPEYSLDWWDRRPLSDDVNWGYGQRGLAGAPKLDLKRQYDRVAELDQLLHYRKKSAEFPDFYDSEDQMAADQEAENERDGDAQRAVTEEEEKELENLAAMDLELQKIAEKFGQRG